MLEYLLAFLYSFMPAGDIADYPEDFFRANVQESIDARNEASWTLPDDVFKHFVLPVRVNNENLDSARIVFHRELAPRIKGMGMRDAVLEVNHWCHEHVSYKPSDARTSSPLATLRTAWGRCGEESTFLVSALRSVAIPARQVYTPRWAHTDDNHAWVEAWVDGEWCFLGACEPEPVLNLGWFNAPASRGLLMHTKVFGDYNGPEDVMQRTHQFTEINVISNYAKCAEATVVVLDEKGHKVSDAAVEWKIYNYAEFFTVSRQQSNTDGESRLTAGLGDMLVMAFKGDKFGYAKVSFGKDSNIKVILNHHIGERFEADIDIVPPAESANLPYVSNEMRAENDRRLALEDSIRLAYRATFPTRENLAEKYSEEQINYILTSEGNYATIMAFLDGASSKHRAIELLSTLTEKDLRDVTLSVLNDHLVNTSPDANVEKILRPRIADEMLTPWRSTLKKVLKENTDIPHSPALLAEWCKENIRLRDDLTIGGTYTTPMGVWRSRTADSKSLPVFFVALCRSLDIEAWVDMVTSTTYYLENGKEIAVDFAPSTSEREHTRGTLALTFSSQPYLDNPEYARHFTLSRYADERFNKLEYDDFYPWNTSFAKGEEVEAGYYLLTTGCRIADGSVLAHISCFDVPEQKKTEQSLTIRHDDTKVSVIGSFNSEARFLTTEGKGTSILQTTGRGTFVVGILSVGSEPTNHALNDIALRKAELEEWGRKIVLLFPSREEYDKYMSAPVKDLPSTVVFGIDQDGSVARELCEGMKLSADAQRPLIIIADTFNRVLFENHGYTIGLGNQLVRVIKTS